MPLSVLVTGNGAPVPPGDVLRRLQAVDAGLGLRWTGQLNQWALTREWPAGDRRRQWVQEGKTNPEAAYDIIGYIPNDCATDQVPEYVRRLLREWPVEETRKLLDRMNLYNAGETQVVAEAIAEASESAVETMVDATRKKGRRTRVIPSAE